MTRKLFRATAATAVCLLAVACTEARKAAPERIVYTDSLTGNEVWQITSDDSMSNMSYFEAQSFTADDKYAVFKSRRGDGRWKLFRSSMADGTVSPLSDRTAAGSYTVHPNGREVCFLDSGIVWAVDVETLAERPLLDTRGAITGDDVRFSSSFTADGHYTLFSSNTEGIGTEIYRAYLPEGRIEKIYTVPTRCSHPLLNPVDPNIVTFVPYPDRQNDFSLSLQERARSWIIRLTEEGDGSLKADARPFLMMPEGFRATHETWSADGERFYFFRKQVRRDLKYFKPVSVCSVDKNGEDLKVYYSNDTVKLGHGLASRDQKWFIADSQDPRTNPLFLINLETGEARIICWPNSSQTTPSQYFHVHPSISASGRYVAFTSDRNTGTPQAFVIPIGKLTGQE